MSNIEMTPEWCAKMIEIILSRLGEMSDEHPNVLAMREALGYYIAVQASFSEAK
jgi:hypothetical protein